MWPQTMAGMDPNSRQTNHDKIARTRLIIASGSIRAVTGAGGDWAGSGEEFVSSAIAPLYAQPKTNASRCPGGELWRRLPEEFFRAFEETFSQRRVFFAA